MYFRICVFYLKANSESRTFSGVKTFLGMKMTFANVKKTLADVKTFLGVKKTFADVK